MHQKVCEKRTRGLVYWKKYFVGLLLSGILLLAACGTPSNSSAAPGLNTTAPQPSPAIRVLTPVPPRFTSTPAAVTPTVPGSTPSASGSGVDPQLLCTIVPLRPDELQSRGFVLKCFVQGAPASDTNFRLQLQNHSSNAQDNAPAFLCAGQLHNGAGICGRQVILPPAQTTIGAGMTIFGSSLSSNLPLGPVAPMGVPVKWKVPLA